MILRVLGRLDFQAAGPGGCERVGIGWGFLVFGDDWHFVISGGLAAAVRFTPFRGVIGPLLPVVAVAVKRAGAQGIVGRGPAIIGAAVKEQNQRTGNGKPSDRLHGAMMKHQTRLAKHS